MPNLSEFERNKLSYKEHDRRFCLKTGGDKETKIKAYDIDVSRTSIDVGFKDYYFATVYKKNKIQGYRSADGIYVGSFMAEKNLRVNFVLVIELEGASTLFKDAAAQVKATLDHFCKETSDTNLSDDGKRHHDQAAKEKVYGFKTTHIVAGLVIGSTSSHKEKPEKYKQWHIVRINSRQPTQDKTPRELFLELAKYTGKKFW